MNATELKRGMVILHEGDLHQVHEYTHVKPGKGGAFLQTKLRNLKTGSMIHYRFRSQENIDVPYLEKKNFQYLYDDGQQFCFMDLESYDQVFLDAATVGDAKNYLVPEFELQLTRHEGNVVGLEMPTTVNLTVKVTDPGHKGDTVSNVTKPATMETGLVIKVPLFIEQGEVLKVDTRTGEFLGRAN
ncbi:MAG: elongation factor P [Planctomycetota bacterium]|nr:elongation factor P [Planctomycetota bacterium]MDP7251466.1 elongation factor P [Planctomycetota bacterium]